MKQIKTIKFAQNIVEEKKNPLDDIYVYDENGIPVYNERGFQVRRGDHGYEDGETPSDVDTLKGGTSNFGPDLPTVTPSTIQTEGYIIDDMEEEKEGELPTEVEEEVIEQDEFPKFGTLFQAFRWAKQNKQTVRIYYITVSGAYIIRDIEPHGDFWARTTLKRILVTWDETVAAIRAFRLDNVQKYEFVGEEFTPKFNFSQRQHNYRKKLRRRKNRKIEKNIPKLM